MQIKRLLFKTSILLIVLTTCTEARRPLRSSPNKYKATNNKGHISNGNKSQGTVNKIAKTDNISGGNGNQRYKALSEHKSLESVGSQSKSGVKQSEEPTPSTDNTVIQPVYINSNQHQNTHSSKNDDFAEGFAEGLAVARRKRRRKTTTLAPSTSTTTMIPCLNEKQTITEGTVICDATTAFTPTINTTKDVTDGSTEGLPVVRRKRRRKTTTPVPSTSTTMTPCLNEKQMITDGTVICDPYSPVPLAPFQTEINTSQSSINI